MRLQSLATTLPCALLAACAAPQLNVTPTYGQFQPDGDISYIDTSGVIPATVDNSVSDLGLDDDESIVGVRADFKWGLPHLTVSTQSTGWDGDGTLSAEFGGIPAAAAVSSELDLALHRFVLTWDLLPTDNLELGLGFGVTVADIEAQVEDVGTSTVESSDEVAPIPVLALRAGARLGRFDLEALVSGLSADTGDVDATFLETDLNARMALFGAPGSVNGSIVLGWRQTDMRFEYSDGVNDADLDLTFDGVYFGLQIGI